MSRSPLDMYQEVVLRHNRDPKGFGALAAATHRGEAFNPICGDQVAVELNIVGGKVSAVGFTAKCCALCRASASVMTGLLMGLAVADVGVMRGDFERMISGDGTPLPGDAGVFSAMVSYPARVKCVALPWKALEAAKI